MTRPALLPDGWELDPDVEQVLGESIGAWWVITDTGQRTAWQDPSVEGNVANMICPVCENAPGVRGDCQECAGRGRVDSVPYAPRPWDEVWPGLWVGGIHCQFGGAAGVPSREGGPATYQSEGGNCLPGSHFDTVLTLFHAPGYEPDEGVPHHLYRLDDADLDPEHHTMIDYLAERVLEDVKNQKHVLVRCQAGLNRSALIAALAVLKDGWDLTVILDTFRRVRSPYVLFNTSFVDYLRTKERERG